MEAPSLAIFGAQEDFEDLCYDLYKHMLEDEISAIRLCATLGLSQSFLDKKWRMYHPMERISPFRTVGSINGQRAQAQNWWISEP